MRPIGGLLGSQLAAPQLRPSEDVQVGGFQSGGGSISGDGIGSSAMKPCGPATTKVLRYMSG